MRSLVGVSVGICTADSEQVLQGIGGLLKSSLALSLKRNAPTEPCPPDVLSQRMSPSSASIHTACSVASMSVFLSQENKNIKSIRIQVVLLDSCQECLDMYFLLRGSETFLSPKAPREYIIEPTDGGVSLRISLMGCNLSNSFGFSQTPQSSFTMSSNKIGLRLARITV